MNHIPRIAPFGRSLREVRMSTEQNPPSPPAPEVVPVENSPGPAAPAERPPPRVWNSEDLLGTEAEALIMHRGQTYRLRCTKQGKLILYK